MKTFKLNDMISRKALIEKVSEIQYYAYRDGEIKEGVKLGEQGYYKEEDVFDAICETPSSDPDLIRKEMYRELERLKRMDVYIMYHEVGEYHFEYHECKGDIQGITQFENGVFVHHYSLIEPITRERFERFCSEVVERENNRELDNNQDNEA